MFGRILGAVISAPIRLANVPVKIVERTFENADRFMFGDGPQTYRRPRENALDRIASSVSESCEDAFEDS